MRDFLGQILNVGDRVIFNKPYGGGFAVGVITKMSPKQASIEYTANINYVRTVPRPYAKIIKGPTIVRADGTT